MKLFNVIDTTTNRVKISAQSAYDAEKCIQTFEWLDKYFKRYIENRYTVVKGA